MSSDEEQTRDETEELVNVEPVETVIEAAIEEEVKPVVKAKANTKAKTKIYSIKSQ